MEWKISDYYSFYKNNSKNKYGKFHKCVFHVHTPASKDYKRYLKSNTAIREEINKSIPMLKDINGEFSLPDLFSDNEEHCLYILMAIKLIEKEIELVLISDHQTIKGIKKLEYAIQEVKANCRFGAVYPEVLSGVEINCADKNHVVAIFPNFSIAEKFMNEFDEEIMDEKEGTYLTSLEVLGRIKNIGGLGYIAHIENSNINKNANFKYKKKLFNDESLFAIGVKDSEKIEPTKERLKFYCDNEFAFILEDDSHSCDELGESFFWIKGNKCNFEMVEDALRDSTISVQYDEPLKNQTSILCMMAFSGKDGFLKSDDHPFMVTFSPGLNSIIGGRGTGKSTIINLLDIILKQSTTDISRLLQLFTMEEVTILIKHNNNEYAICFTPEKEISDVKEYLLQKCVINKFRNIESIDEVECQRLIISHLQIYKFKNQINGSIKYESIRKKDDKISFFKEVYSRSFSVHELVKNAEDKRSLNKFIIETLFAKKQILRTRKGYLKAGNSLLSEIKIMDSKLKKRCEIINSYLDKFNIDQKDIIKITYNVEKFDASWFMKNLKLSNDKLFGNFNITNNSVSDFLILLFRKYGCMEGLIKLLEKDTVFINYSEIEDYVLPYNSKFIGEKKYIDIELKFEKFKKTLSEFIISESDTILKSIDTFYYDFEFLGIDFNLKEQNNVRNFKDIKYLSSGQKTVGMLSFILGYSKKIEERTPLIIDQPEDNLDNKYIYETLVSVLRSQKNSRQVMVATHNSTIVISAKSEQVIIMSSNNINGWIEKSGYYIEKSILKAIIDILEAGKDSFKKRLEIYKKYL